MWSERAACKGHPENLWFGSGDSSRAKAICATCEVKHECLEDALATPVSLDFGIRGGISIRARDQIRKKRRSKQIKYKLKETDN